MSKHKFSTVIPSGNTDWDHHIFECERCLQEVRIDKDLWVFMVTTKNQLSEFYMKQIFWRITRCNPDRDLIIVEIPVIPKCTVCHKRYVIEPGSKGIDGALCRVCYYDL